MCARTGPQDHIGTPQIVRHLLARQHGAVGDMAGYQRLAVAHDFVAHLRPHAVAANEATASDALARLQDYGDAGIVLVEVLDRAIGLQRDQIVALAGIDEDGMEVVPVSDGVRLLKTLGKARVIEWNAGHALAAERATHLYSRWAMSIGEHRLLKAESLKRAEDVGAELDAGTDFAEFSGLLEDPNREPFARECVRRRQPPDAAARNYDRQCLTIRFCHQHSKNAVRRRRPF